MKIAVDFDGTCVDHRFPEVGPDAPYAVGVMERWIEEGHMIILNTMRSGDYLLAAVKWFENHGIELSGINEEPNQKKWTSSPKVFGNLYVDDAAAGCPMIHPEGFERPCVDWEEISYIVENME